MVYITWGFDLGKYSWNLVGLARFFGYFSCKVVVFGFRLRIVFRVVVVDVFLVWVVVFWMVSRGAVCLEVGLGFLGLDKLEGYSFFSLVRVERWVLFFLGMV